MLTFASQSEQSRVGPEAFRLLLRDERLAEWRDAAFPAGLTRIITATQSAPRRTTLHRASTGAGRCLPAP